MNTRLERDIQAMTRKFCFLAAFVFRLTSIHADQVRYRNGDIIFQETRSGQAEAVKRATGSPYSHVGVIYFRNKRAYVLEAVQPVKLTPLPQFISHGVKKRYVVKRLKDPAPLTRETERKMYAAARRYLGKNYDWVFGWSDERIYCSELVWKIYKQGAGVELVAPRKLKDFNLADPVVKKKLAERYGEKIPFEEPVVSPGQLFDSALLETIYEQ
jgi:uncharacterized protein YycO